MNLSRCNWLRLLVVGAGTATAGNVEYELGPGGKIVLLEEGTCPNENVDLVFKSTRKEVDELISNKKIIQVAEDENYSLEWEQFNVTTAMHYDLETNLATFFASDVATYYSLTEFVKKTGGAYTLTDPTAMNMLQFFPGLTVCIDDPDIIAKFKDAYPDKVAWANLFKYVVTAQGSFHLEIDYLRVEVEEGPKVAMSELEVVNGKSVVIPDGCLESKEEIEEVVNTLFKKRIEEGKEEILFGKGCVKLALAHPTIRITKDLADELKSLGDVAVWAKPHRDAYIEEIMGKQKLGQEIILSPDDVVKTYYENEEKDHDRLDELTTKLDKLQKEYSAKLAIEGLTEDQIEEEIRNRLILKEETDGKKWFLPKEEHKEKGRLTLRFEKEKDLKETKARLRGPYENTGGPIPFKYRDEDEYGLALRKTYTRGAQKLMYKLSDTTAEIKVEEGKKLAEMAKTGGKV
eukprot:GHVS01059923.1.p1 GENE.GHVS01059923.1~~GHVS01059923.1.p1  ORF type:complete len:460 (-),score=57.05 GHVS01059923.1:117-1496(-)